jgi:hypothetical protein
MLLIGGYALGQQTGGSGAPGDNSGSGGGPLTGSAGGVLTGTYPNPSLASPLILPASTSGQVINGTSYSAYYPQTTLTGRINACAADAMNRTNGNTTGICNSTGEVPTQTDTSGGTIAIGDLTGDVMTWIHPAICHWTLSGYSGGTSDLIDLYGGSAIEGPTPVNNPCEIIYGGSSDGAYALFQAINTTTSNAYFKVKGMGFMDSKASLASGATMVINSTNDGSIFEDLLVTNYEPGQSAILLNDVVAFGQCCTTTFNRVVANGNYASGPILTIIASNTTNQFGVEFTNVSLTHPGIGFPIISCTSNNVLESLYFDNLYEEANKNDTTTALNQISGCLAIKVSGMTVMNPTAAAPTAGPIWQLNGTAHTSIDISGLTATHGITDPAIAVQNNVAGYNCASTPCNVMTDANGNLGHYTSATFQGDVINASVGFDVAGAPLAFANIAGAAAAGQGGTGTTNLTGLRYANGGSADTAAATAQLQAAIGSGVYVPAGGYYAGVATGAVNAMAVSLPASLGNPTLAQLTGVLISFLPNLANTNSGPTLNVNGLGAVAIVKGSNTILAGGDLAASATAFLVFNGTNFVLQNPQVLLTQTGATGGFSLAGTLSFSGSNGINTQSIRGNSATASLSVQGGNDGGNATEGALTMRGGTTTLSTGVGGNTTLEAGAAPSAGTQGLASVQQSFTGATALAVTFAVVSLNTTADQVQAAPLGSATKNIGIAQTVGGTNTQLYVATDGKSTARFDGTPVLGDIACFPPASTGTAGLAHDNGSTACPAGQKLGIVTGQVSGTGSGATATVLLQIGS